VLFIERPKSEDSVDDDEDELKPQEVLTGVFDVPSDFDKCVYRRNSLSTDYEIPALPPRFGVAASGGGPCYGEPPLPLPGADDDLFGPGAGYGAGAAASVCGAHNHSPTFDKPSHEMEKTIEDARFIAQHVKNKDKFENVSSTCSLPLYIAICVV
jgi:nicotinic acetylcholine receptor